MAEIPENKRRSTGKRVLIILAALIALNAALELVFASMTEKGETYALSHRGAAALAPENTLAAVRAGVSAGAPFIEIDIRLTSDGVPVLMHDASLDRTTDGTGRVRERTWEYVNSLDAGSSFSEEFKAEHVPHLGTVLEYMKGASSTLLIEVKDPAGNPAIGDTLAEYLKRYGMEKRVVVISFDAAWAERFGKLMPGTALGALYVYPFGTPPPGRSEIRVRVLARLRPRPVSRVEAQARGPYRLGVEYRQLLRRPVPLVEGSRRDDARQAGASQRA